MQELREKAIKILNNKLSYFNDKSNFDEVFTPDIYYHMCFSCIYAYNEIGAINAFETQNFIDKLNTLWRSASNDI